MGKGSGHRVRCMPVARQDSLLNGDEKAFRGRNIFLRGRNTLKRIKAMVTFALTSPSHPLGYGLRWEGQAIILRAVVCNDQRNQCILRYTTHSICTFNYTSLETVPAEWPLGTNWNWARPKNYKQGNCN